MLVHWIWLSLRKGLNDREKCALLAEFPDPEDLFYAEESRILSLTAGKETAREALLDKNLTEAEEILAQCGEKKISILCYADRGLPGTGCGALRTRRWSYIIRAACRT